MPLADLPPLAAWIKPWATIALLAAFWSWESVRPFFAPSRGRWRHAAHNVAIALLNTLVLALVFSAATVGVTHWAAAHGYGLLRWLDLPWPWRLLLALLLLDAWLYVWHRANHAIPLLWRFHRMHHADDAMDVTTATRFHLGEHLGAATLRLGLIPLFGVDLWHLVTYETLVVAITMLHHANISLGRCDAPLRWVIVTPDMHKVHHSRWRPETNSNYATLFSWWDRLARTYCQRDDCRTLALGLDEFCDPRWQTVRGMLATPFVAGEPPRQEQGES